MKQLCVHILAVAALAGCPRERGGPTFQPDAVDAPPPRLTFTPPDGRLLHERSVTTRAGPGGVERVEAMITARYDRIQDGWLLTQWVPQVRVLKDDQPAPPQPLADLVSRFPLKLQLAEDGAFIQFRNPEDAEAAVRSTFPDPAQAGQVLAYFTPEAIERQARREWEDRYGGLFNRDLTPQLSLYSVESFALADGTPVRYVVERRFTGISPSAHGATAVLSVRCLGAREEVAKLPQALKALEASGDMGVEPTVSCDGQQLLALSPFLPVRRWMRLSARPTASGTPMDVSLSREVTLLELGEGR